MLTTYLCENTLIFGLDSHSTQWEDYNTHIKKYLNFFFVRSGVAKARPAGQANESAGPANGPQSFLIGQSLLE